MINPMPCLASLFDAMSGVKKLTNFLPAINYPTSAFEPSFDGTKEPLLQLLVEDVFPKASGASPLEAGDHVGQLLDGLDLLVQVVALEEVAEVGVIVFRGQLVHAQQGLVDLLLQLKGFSEALVSPGPLLGFGRVDGLQHHSATTGSLVLHQLVGMLPLLITLFSGEFSHALEGHIIPLIVGCH